MTKIWLKLQLHFSQKTTTKTKLKSAVKINTAVNSRRTTRRCFGESSESKRKSYKHTELTLYM